MAERGRMIPELAAVPMPARIARLPRDDRGYPVPAFVPWQDGKPYFPAASTPYMALAIRGQPASRPPARSVPPPEM